MVEQRQAQRRGRVLGGVRPTGEDHRATTFELFFDLVVLVLHHGVAFPCLLAQVGTQERAPLG
jgi:hypothetical protein